MVYNIQHSILHEKLINIYFCNAMPQKLKFYDIKAKQAFETDKYETVEKNTARGPMIFAVATSPYTGIKVWRLIGKKK
jgi:hypothetical protein